MKKRITLGLIAIVTIAFTGCEKEQAGESLKGDIVISTTIPNPNETTKGRGYLQVIDGFKKQVVDNKKAYPIPYITVIQQQKNDLYVFPDYMGDTKHKLVKYSFANQTLEEAASLNLPENSRANNITFLNDSKAYVSMQGLGKIMIINPQTMTKTGEIDLHEYGVDDKNPDPSSMLIRDGLLYVPLNQMVGGYMPKPDRPFSDVAIIDTKTDKALKMITEKQSDMSFPARPTDSGTIFTDENNDIYIACIGAFGFLSNHKSGFLRIKAGETEFDTDYSWTVSDMDIDGEAYTDNYIFSAKYIGNGKLCAYIVLQKYAKNDAYKSIASQAVEINLKEKTIKKIKNIPLSDPFSVVISRYKNLIIFANYGTESGGFYSYNPQTGEVSEGPVITTTGKPGFFYQF